MQKRKRETTRSILILAGLTMAVPALAEAAGGLAVYTLADGSGYLICTDQIDGNSEYRVYRREGKPGNPHGHSEVVKVFRGRADSTDGLEATSASLGPRLPRGLVVAMNSAERNFLIYDWMEVVRATGNKLKAAAAAGGERR